MNIFLKALQKPILAVCAKAALMQRKVQNHLYYKYKYVKFYESKKKIIITYILDLQSRSLVLLRLQLFGTG